MFLNNLLGIGDLILDFEKNGLQKQADHYRNVILCHVRDELKENKFFGISNEKICIAVDLVNNTVSVIEPLSHKTALQRVFEMQKEKSITIDKKPCENEIKGKMIFATNETKAEKNYYGCPRSIKMCEHIFGDRFNEGIEMLCDIVFNDTKHHIAIFGEKQSGKTEFLRMIHYLDVFLGKCLNDTNIRLFDDYDLNFKSKRQSVIHAVSLPIIFASNVEYGTPFFDVAYKPKRLDFQVKNISQFLEKETEAFFQYLQTVNLNKLLGSCIKADTLIYEVNNQKN
ncbi:MAG: hypothetical protein WC389_10055 [Lutibacter sp.]|jgi:hypothetical protein